MLFSSGVAHATTFTTELVHTFSTTGESNISDIVAFGANVIVNYDDKLWISDGTDAGTVEIEFSGSEYGINDIAIESSQSNQHSAVFGDELYFFAFDNLPGSNQLFRTDGTAETRVNSLICGLDDYYSLVVRGENLYAWIDPIISIEGETTSLVEITPGGALTVIDGGNDCSTSEHPSQIQLIGTKLIYVNDPTENGDYGLFAYDTVTEEIEELNGPAGDLYASDNYIDDVEDRFFIFEGEMYFGAEASGVGNELFATDGTPAGTVKVSDFAGGFAVGNADATFVEAGGELFFAVGNYTSGGGDGTVALYKIGSREDSDNLAATGTDAAASLWAGLGLLVAGATVVTVRRRLVK